MLPIQKKHISYNYSNTNESKKYIVIHDTGNSARGANAQAHFNYFNGGDRQASANYFVDDSNIMELVDPNLKAWHCGDGGGAYGITNGNSIGVEICINSDGNYDKAVNNAIELTKYIMDMFGIDESNVVRHYDASRKNCPATMASNGWAKWNWFKSQLTNKNSNQEQSKSDNDNLSVIGYGTVTASALNVRDGASTQYNIIGSLSNGDRVKICSKQGDWLNILFGDNRGWVYASYIKLDAEESSGQYAIVNADVLNVRSGCSTSYSVIGQLTRGERVKLDSKSGDWWSIYFGDHGGFIHGDYITIV